MPVMFVGHGSPMNAVTDNKYIPDWRRLGQMLHPRAILCVSAHWYTKGTKVNPAEEPEQIYDMYGFPEELYKVKYPVKGSPEVASRVRDLLDETQAAYSDSWGIDHGTWSVMRWMFPDADIPIVQLSIDGTQQGAAHYELGRKLAPLRDEGVLIVGSGNIVHNLRRVDWNSDGGAPWAYDFDDLVGEGILCRQHEKIIDYKSIGDLARQAVPTPDHYYPLLYALGASDEADPILIFNKYCELGSISMTGYLFGEPV